MNWLMPWFGIGVAGNSAGHLQQTGEGGALPGLSNADEPQAIFPFYAPGATEQYLSINPYSAEIVSLPQAVSASVQMEPEVALIAKVTYEGGAVRNLAAESITLLNDVTYRNLNAAKLAQKKNWGSASKGVARKTLPISGFSDSDGLGRYRYCSFHATRGVWQLCCNDVSLSDYSLCYEPLICWLVNQINTQQEAGPLHSIKNLLRQSNYPERMIISLGSSRYTDYGEQHRLLKGDQVCAVLYDATVHCFSEIQSAIVKGNFDALNRKHVLLWQTCEE